MKIRLLNKILPIVIVSFFLVNCAPIPFYTTVEYGADNDDWHNDYQQYHEINHPQSQIHIIPAKHSTKHPKPIKHPPHHTAFNSLDWTGVYEGILPCADCEGIKTTLILTRDGYFELYEVYLKGRRNFKPSPLKGKILWDSNRPVIYLSDSTFKRSYFIGEGYIKMYDIEGRPIRSKLNYTLKKIR